MFGRLTLASQSRGLNQDPRAGSAAAAADVARKDSLRTLQRGAHGAYLQTAALTALRGGATSDDSSLKRLNTSLLVNFALSASAFFNVVNRVPPLGRSKDFVTNQRVSSYIDAAQGAIRTAVEWEVAARKEEDTTYGSVFEAQIAATQALKSNMKDPLEALSGVLVEGDSSGLNFGNLGTPEQLNDYLAEVFRRVQRALAQGYRLEDVGDAQNDLGDIGRTILALASAKLEVEKAQQDLANIAKEIEIAANLRDELIEISRTAGRTHRAKELAIGIASAYSTTFSESVEFSTLGPPTVTVGVSITFNSGAITAANLRNEQQLAQELKEIASLKANTNAEINRRLLGISNAVRSLQQAGIAYNITSNDLKEQLDQVRQLAEDLRRAWVVDDTRFFNDPAYRLYLKYAQNRARGTLPLAQARFYELTRAVGYYWSEEYNDIIKAILPGDSAVSVPNLNPGFLKFEVPEDIFAFRSAQDCRDALGMLCEWDRLLRLGPTGSSNAALRKPTRPPDPDGDPIDESIGLTREISLRDDVFGFQGTENERIVQLQQLLLANHFPFGVERPGFMVSFPLTLELYKFELDNQRFNNPFIDRNEKNIRIRSVEVNLRADSGFLNICGTLNDAPCEDVRGYVAITGHSVNRSFFAFVGEPPQDILVPISLGDFPDTAKRKLQVDGVVDFAGIPFIQQLPFRINGRGRSEVDYSVSGALQNLPFAATGWYIVVSPFDTNVGVNIRRVRDIVLKISYWYGQPDDFFAGLRAQK